MYLKYRPLSNLKCNANKHLFKKHNFQSNKDWQYYSLYFEPMVQVDRMINLIEVEKGNRNDFNYYNIFLNMKDGMEIG